MSFPNISCDTGSHVCLCVCVCACVRACLRACLRACVRVCVPVLYIQKHCIKYYTSFFSQNALVWQHFYISPSKNLYFAQIKRFTFSLLETTIDKQQKCLNCSGSTSQTECEERGHLQSCPQGNVSPTSHHNNLYCSNVVKLEGVVYPMSLWKDSTVKEDFYNSIIFLKYHGTIHVFYFY